MGERRHWEAELQRKFFTFIRRVRTFDPRLGLIYSVPNEGAQTEQRRLYCYRLGMLGGVSDVNVDLPSVGGRYGYLRIEFKSDTGKQTAPQEAYEHLVGQYGGGQYVVCRSMDGALRALAEHLGEAVEYWEMLYAKYGVRERGNGQQLAPVDIGSAFV